MPKRRWKQERLEAAGVTQSGLSRSEVIKRLTKLGFNNINSHDISWATKMGLISPRIIADNLHLYDDDDVYWMTVLSKVKSAGLDKRAVEALLPRTTLRDIIDLTRRINNNRLGDNNDG